MNLQKPKFSVIIPTYNRKEKLKNSIASVNSQTFSSYEILIVDDASEDGTSDWVSKNHPDINLITLVKNKGAAGARNEAIKQAKGEYIAFLDSDDQWLPHYLEAHIEILSVRPDVVLSASDFIGDKEEIIFSKVWSIYPNAIHHMIMAPLISTMSVAVIRRDVFEKSGLLNESLAICHDRDLYLRVLRFGDFVNISRPLATRVQGEDSLTQKNSLYCREVFKVLDIFFADSKNKSYKHLESEAKSKWALNIAKWAWVYQYKSLLPLWISTWMIIKAIYYSPKLILNSTLQRLRF